MLDTLDDAAVHRWCGGGLAALRAHQHEIDELNVYPVPDGDTGTNLVLTLTSAAEALEGEMDGERDSTQTPLGRAMRRMARGALLGARGNSGVIVSQILRGMADTFATSVAVRGGELARALRTASEAAYAAVAHPVEGTVLSVVAAAADAAGKIQSDDLIVVARAASRAAAEALARTPQQLPVLARAGVVDAGGRGLCLLLDALVEALTGSAPAVMESVVMPVQRELEKTQYGYEVQYLLDAHSEAVETLKVALDSLGDSLVVVGTGEGTPPTWNVHVHVDDIGAAIEAGVEAGRPHRIAVTRLEDRLHTGDVLAIADHDHDHLAPGNYAGTKRAEAGDGAGTTASDDRAAAQTPSSDRLGDDGQAGEGDQTTDPRPPLLYRRADDRQPPREGRGAVVVAAGDGLTALFAAEGATVVDRNPSTAEMLDAIAATGAGRVVLLPNDANTHAVASAAAREAADTGVRVSVVPTRSPVQALAALAVRDPERAFADDVIAMAEAAGACRYGEVCTARREALTVAGRCRPGDLLGLLDGEVHVIGSDLDEVCRRLLDRMLGGGGELTTLILGADAPAALEETLAAHVAQTWPFVELNCYTGGQPQYHLLVGVE